MKYCYAVLDAEGFVTATHAGPSDTVPIAQPDGGSFLRVGEDSYKRLVGIFNDGKRARIVEGFINEEDALLPSTVAQPATPESVQNLRRKKMLAINETSVISKNRRFPVLPHLQLRDQHPQIDAMYMVLSGELKGTDTFLTRNIKSGEYESITADGWREEMRASFYIRQKLREREQEFRDKVNAVYRDPALTEEEKLTLIDAIEVPEHLDVDEKSTPHNLMLKGKSGSE